MIQVVVGFFVGVGATLALLVYVLWKALFADVEKGVPSVPAVEIKFNRSSEKSIGSSNVSNQDNEVPWLNAFAQVMWNEIVGNDSFMAVLREKIERAFNKDRPSWLAAVELQSLDLGSICPTVRHVCHTQDNNSGELLIFFYASWEGHALISVKTALTVASRTVLPLQAGVSVRRLHGWCVLHVPSNNGGDPCCRLGAVDALTLARWKTSGEVGNVRMEEGLVVETRVDTSFGANASVSNIPKVGSYLERKVEQVIQEALMLPKGGFVLFLPVPYVRKALMLTAAKKRTLVSQGVDLKQRRAVVRKKKPTMGDHEAPNRVTESVPVDLPQKAEVVVDTAQVEAVPPIVMQSMPNLESSNNNNAKETESIASKLSRFADGIIGNATSSASQPVHKLPPPPDHPPKIPTREGNPSYITTTTTTTTTTSTTNNAPVVANDSSEEFQSEDETMDPEGSDKPRERKRDKLKRLASNVSGMLK